MSAVNLAVYCVCMTFLYSFTLYRLNASQGRVHSQILWGKCQMNQETNYSTWKEFDQFQKRQARIISHTEKSSIWGRYEKAIQGGPPPPSTSTLYAIGYSTSTRQCVHETQPPVIDNLATCPTPTCKTTSVSESNEVRNSCSVLPKRITFGAFVLEISCNNCLFICSNYSTLSLHFLSR